MARIEKRPTGEFHSGYGCVILAAAIGVFGFIIWWAWYSLTTMDQEIAAIAQVEPAKLADVAPQPGLAQKLADFAQAATAAPDSPAAQRSKNARTSAASSSSTTSCRVFGSAS